MHKHVIAVTGVALYALLAVLAGVVTDFHDRFYPQALGVTDTITVDFTNSPWDRDAALTGMQQLNTDYDLGLYKLLPDLDSTGSQLYVDLTQPTITDPQPLNWFAADTPAHIVGTDTLTNSVIDGAYLITQPAQLGQAIAHLQALGVDVTHNTASPVDSITGLAATSGFAAPILAACALMGAITVYWLAAKARSRALRVLAGTPPWRIQLHDLGTLFAIIIGGATVVFTTATVTIGATRGWEFVPLYATILAVFSVLTLTATTLIALALSAISWPNTDLFARRTPAVATLRTAAKIVQIATLAAVIVYIGPAWTATTNAAATARQLDAWNQLSNEVHLSFAMLDDDMETIAPTIGTIIRDAEHDNQAALSYTIFNDTWGGNFGPYSAISIVNTRWLDLMTPSVASENTPTTDAPTNTPDTPATTMAGLEPAGEDAARIVTRELAPTLELWAPAGRTPSDILADSQLLTPTTNTAYPVAHGGTAGQLSFLNDVLIITVPTITGTFNDTNLTALASSANIILTDPATTHQRLIDAGLTRNNLTARGIDGSIQPLYVAEQGILEAQFATYLAQLLTLSIAALTIAFIVSVAINAVIASNLNARRDFPLRLAGHTWETVTRPRATTDLLIGVIITGIIVALQPADTLLITAGAATLGMIALYTAHPIAASIAFRHVTRRTL
ncbi:hypothetical protein [Jonesia denitrificans]|uniref:Uncharacterized protein n=1 Tax=Jonesia denitrificans (strain ATCC 14870 / DSM 20603 / BCRC 15368 / CIP 55.134 / JCM 11481 / NBRC 15587 / NCTC 10816 / Prevot 55134) TaxID=471856 RepID=C7R543_JONDD|nr:hypothetical protein [Jonesia denitrificans]ACV07721.1 hypothetical protein Jden_0042 [Jonesia denitrificans DSM 20603]ASE08556.1 hypothetical protein CEP80_04990 [Jonesia denitrificans]QXB43165.1 hypothetical protein I6L70_11820 [Jonesia denitrificans]SQH19689.1 Uncharacterized protein conserved in bacteria [Jonesia denitrificans]